MSLKRRDFLKRAALAGAGVMTAGLSGLDNAYGQCTAGKPNLLMIMTDQMRYDVITRAQQDMGVPAESRIQTPNLDRLISEGAWFKRAYVPAAVCGPCRTSLLTGHSIFNTGVGSNDQAYDVNNPPGAKIESLVTYDEVLVNNQGYTAEFFGKWHTPEMRGHCYSNDVTIAGSAWADFGSGLVPGMKAYYVNYLDGVFIQTAPVDGQQMDMYTERSYWTDPLDIRYGMPPGTPYTGTQPDCHGMTTIPAAYSMTAKQAMDALDAIDRLHTGPFSITCSLNFPHAPMLVPEPYYNMYDPADMIPPVSISDLMTNSAYTTANGRTTKTEYADPEKVKRWMANYYGLVTEIDHWVGLLLDKLDQYSIADCTMVVFISDHGEMLGAHGMREKNVFLEESAHVPFIIRLPGIIPAGTVVDNPVACLDMYATIIDYLQVPSPGSYPSDGTSLRRHIEGTDTSDQFIVTEWNFDRPDGTESNYLVVKGSYKFMITNNAASGNPNALDMLYDLSTDPWEMNNLIGNLGMTASDAVIGKAEHLKALLVEWLTANGQAAYAAEVEARRMWRLMNIWVSDTRLDFQNVTAGGSGTEAVYLGVTTSGPLNITSIIIEGPDAALFSVDWTTGSISGGQHQKVNVTFNDDGSLREMDARIRIEHDAGSPRYIDLRGAASGRLSASDSVLAFRGQKAGASTERMLGLYNVEGTASVNILSAQIAGPGRADFSLGEVPVSIAAGATGQLAVYYTPSENGRSDAILTIQSDGGQDIIVELAGVLDEVERTTPVVSPSRIKTEHTEIIISGLPEELTTSLRICNINGDTMGKVESLENITDDSGVEFLGGRFQLLDTDGKRLSPGIYYVTANGLNSFFVIEE